MSTEVYLETGKTWSVACAVDWPGWCRRGKGEEAALEELLAYADRYAEVAGREFRPGALHVVARVPGKVSTDMGIPDAKGPWDDPPVTAEQVRLLTRCWERFDELAAGASAELRKGPRGGGRDRDAIVEHVREPERAYGRRLGVAVPPRTPWPEQRAALLARLAEGEGERWTPRYFVRRTAWHVLDHAWEIEDKDLS
jgi:hypothetical protein